MQRFEKEEDGRQRPGNLQMCKYLSLIGPFAKSSRPTKLVPIKLGLLQSWEAGRMGDTSESLPELLQKHGLWARSSAVGAFECFRFPG